MQTRSRINLVLVVVALALLLWSVLLSQNDIEQASVLTDINPASIQHIVIENTQHDPIKFQLERHWRITAPLQAYAREVRVQSMLAILSTQSFTLFEQPQAEQLEQMGFSETSPVLHLDENRFHFGGTDPLNNHRYVLWQENVHLVQDGLFYQIQQPLGFFVRPKILPPDTSITAISLPDLSLTLQGGNWTAVPELSLSQEQLSLYISKWQQLESTAVIALAEYESGTSLQITLLDSAKLFFHVLHTPDRSGLIRTDLGLFYQIDSRLLEALLDPGNHTDA